MAPLFGYDCRDKLVLASACLCHDMLGRAAVCVSQFDADDRLISGDVEDVLLSQWELLRDHGLLLGSGWWRIGWDMFMTLVVVTSVILTPYRIAFEQVRWGQMHHHQLGAFAETASRLCTTGRWLRDHSVDCRDCP